MPAIGQFARALSAPPQNLLAASLGMLVLVAIATAPASAGGDQPPTAGGQTQPSGIDPDAIVLRSRVFDIPFQMDAGSKATKIRLYVSTDRGQNWQVAQEEPISISQFHYEATSDGDHWFTTATDLRPLSAPTSELVPQRKVYIDTTGPEIKLDGSADLNGKLTAHLELVDPQQVTNLRVLYATDVVRQWQTVTKDLISERGEFQLAPKEDWRQISVHVTATDALGNRSVQAKTFRRPRIAATTPQDDSPRPHRDPATANSVDSTAGQPVMAQADNRLRVQTVSGPGDPPRFLLGPQSTADSYTAPAPQGFNLRGVAPPPATPVNRFPLPPPPRTAAPTATAPNSSVPAASTPARSAMPSSTTPTPNNSFSLPASGLTVKTTVRGVEVLPPGPGQSETLPTTVATPTANAANAATGNAAPATSGLPITESVAVPTPDPAFNAPDFNAPAVNTPAPTRMRTLRDAMRPLSTDNRSPNLNTASGPESIPTPTASQTPQDTRRYRAERAEQTGREQQLRFDRAQLARNVPFRYSDSNRFSLEYELEAVASTGVESVELYGSIDAGRTWKRWGADPDRSSPFDIETNGEGVFAFRIVVLGNNGLASPRPLPGDDPDIAVIVDQSLPKVKVTSARYGEGDRIGSLVINYECEDENLMSRPVAIAFSDSLEGPWTTIAAGLRNDGLYVWPADPKLPPQIYLRLDATDQAGNVGSYLLDQPIATGGLAPRARILGFRSR
ncbi:hypothetical protein NHH03_24555 [Stieleria sp. TO1_6]|uniref:hypothetical protein n=1 Tax=Stieleria tagensis TaxID=2956795 RepID=UPI00209AC164|nr:hypothetical protein [Stieleria tagensis]MCO8124932.1 hypothetical protein [Stieleria tagensis]